MDSGKSSNRNLLRRVATSFKSNTAMNDKLLSQFIELYENGDVFIHHNLKKLINEYNRVKSDEEIEYTDVSKMNITGYRTKSVHQSLDADVSVIVTDADKKDDDDESKRDIKSDHVFHQPDDEPHQNQEMDMVPLGTKIREANQDHDDDDDDNSYDEWLNDERTNNILDELTDNDEPTSQRL